MLKDNLESRSTNHKKYHKAFLIESSWETCNQIGGICTVLRSKSSEVKKHWGENYCMLGPYVEKEARTNFQALRLEKTDPVCQAVEELKTKFGIKAHYGEWLTSGRPKVVLLEAEQVYNRIGEIKYNLWEYYGINFPGEDELIDPIVAFGHLTEIFFNLFRQVYKGRIIAHFHEWMTGTGLLGIKKQGLDIQTVFTTHATLLGRYLAVNDSEFYQHLPYYNWEREAENFNIETQVKIERATAHTANVLSTVSQITAEECKYLLGRIPEAVLPNGLNVHHHTDLHELQTLHRKYKEKIHEFVIGHFFSSYNFDLDNTLYFFTSGRFEYQNKGFDLCIEALAKLNYLLKKEGSKKTVVMFFITKQAYHTINPKALHSRAMMEELRKTTQKIQKQIGKKLFYNITSSNVNNEMPDLNNFVDEYWNLRLKKTLQSWRTEELPPVITHNLVDDTKDPILNFFRVSKLINNQSDKVKVVYHPDFINSSNPLFGMDYEQFMRACHLGVFPSFYEPWGYTPLETTSCGIPAITSDLSGFGDYVLEHLPSHSEKGIYVNKRKNKSFEESANHLANRLYEFTKLNRRERIDLRNKTDEISSLFNWKNLFKYYSKVYDSLLENSIVYNKFYEEQGL